MTLGALLLALHLLGAAIWVGGICFALAALRPGMAFLDSAQRLKLHEAVFRRFIAMIWVVMPAMLLTGTGMEMLFYGGFAATPWPLQAMTVTGTLMAGVFIATSLVPWRNFRRALARDDPAEAGNAVRLMRLMVLANLILGTLTVVLAVLDV
jgi:uncharacterized membrane protein